MSKKECCLLCKSYSSPKTTGGLDRAAGWCMRRRLSVHGGFWCSQFRQSYAVSYAQEARAVSVVNPTPWD